MATQGVQLAASAAREAFLKKPPEARAKGVKIFGGVLVLLLVTYGTYLIYKNANKDSEADLTATIDELNTRKTDSAASLNAVLEGQDLTPEDIQEVTDILNAPPTEDELATQQCGFYPLTGIVCRTNFAYDEGSQCCKPVADEPPTGSEVAQDMAKTIVTAIVIDQMAELILLHPDTVYKGVALIGKGLGKVAAVLAPKATAKASAYLARKVGMKIAGKVMAKLLAKLTFMASMGPGGAALMAFDVLSLALDFLDPRGYDLYSANSMLSQQDRLQAFIAWQMQMSMEGSWPMMMPIGGVYPAVYENFVTPMQSEYYITPALGAYMDEASVEELELMMSPEFDTPEVQGVFQTKFADYVDEFLNADPELRDQRIFDSLREGLPDAEKDDVFLCPWMSLPDRIGISLTKEKSEAWNESNMAVWSHWLNEMNGPTPNKYKSADGTLNPNVDGHGFPLPQPPFADFSDWYYVPDEESMEKDGFKESQPPMLAIKLDGGAVSLAGNMKQMSYVMCVGQNTREGEKGKADITIYPGKFGVEWKMGQCHYTKEYCEEMNLSFTGGLEMGSDGIGSGGDWIGTPGDCYMNKGQEVAEQIFGTTITREFVAWGNDIKECGSNPSLSACGNAIAGPLIKGAVGLMSNTAKSIGACAGGDSSACGAIFSEGLISAPGQLIGGLGHGLAGLSAMGGDYTAFMTAPFTAIGNVGELLADPLGTLLDPVGTLKVMAAIPGAVLDGVATTLNKIPVIGPLFAAPFALAADIMDSVAGLVVDVFSDILPYTPFGIFMNIFGFNKPDPPTPEEIAEAYKEACLKDASDCRLKWGDSMETNPDAAYCKDIAPICENITVSTMEHMDWGQISDPSEKSNAADAIFADSEGR